MTTIKIYAYNKEYYNTYGIYKTLFYTIENIDEFFEQVIDVIEMLDYVQADYVVSYYNDKMPSWHTFRKVDNYTKEINRLVDIIEVS